MKKILPIFLKIYSVVVWTIVKQLMSIVTSKNSIITAESMNNRNWYLYMQDLSRKEEINESNAKTMTEILKET